MQSAWVNLDSSGKIVAFGDGLRPTATPPDGGHTEIWATTATEIAARFALSGPRRVTAEDGKTITVTVSCPSRGGKSVLVQVNDAVLEVDIDPTQWGEEIIIPAYERTVGWDEETQEPITETVPAVTKPVPIGGGTGTLELDASTPVTYVVTSGEPGVFPALGHGTLIVEVV